MNEPSYNDFSSYEKKKNHNEKRDIWEKYSWNNPDSLWNWITFSVNFSDLTNPVYRCEMPETWKLL